MKIRSIILGFLVLSGMLFVSCEQTELATETGSAELDHLLSQYPSEITEENYMEFATAPNEVLAYFDAKEEKIAKAPVLDTRVVKSKEEVLREMQGSVGVETAGTERACNCNYITGIVPNSSSYPESWIGGMFADLNESGTISTFDIVIMQKIINNYDGKNDNDVDGAITGWGETLGDESIAEYDYDRDGNIDTGTGFDSDDNWAAAMYTWQLSDIESLHHHFDNLDKECVRQRVLAAICQ